jgi:hypothetical protein
VSKCQCPEQMTEQSEKDLQLADIIISDKPILQLEATVEIVLIKGCVVYESSNQNT